MKKKIFKKGTVIAKQGDRLESVVMIQKGKIKVSQRLNTGTKSQGVIREEANVELAELECNDMFGILEVVLGSMKKIKREALASSTVEAYVIQ
jgi:CRP-like cAMP-binding protein